MRTNVNLTRSDRMLRIGHAVRSTFFLMFHLVEGIILTKSQYQAEGWFLPRMKRCIGWRRFM